LDCLCCCSSIRTSSSQRRCPASGGRSKRRALGIGSHWPFDQWGRFLPEHTTAVSLLDRLLHHSIVVVTEGESFRMRQARNQGGTRMNKT
jgi:hypothetical protein